MRSERAAVIRWTLGLPFFVMPLSLTIDAPDVHGGWHGHILQAVALAAVGAFVGALVSRGGGWSGRAPRALAGLLAGALLGWWLATSGAELGRHLAVLRAALTGRAPTGGGDLSAKAGAVATALVFSLRLVRSGAPAPVALLSLASWVPLVVAFVGLVAPPGPAAAVGVVIVVLLMGSTIGRLPVEVAAPSAMAGVGVLAAAWAASSALGPLEPGASPRPSDLPLVLLHLLWGVLAAWLCRRFLRRATDPGAAWERLVTPPRELLGTVLLVVGLSFGAGALLPLARLLGDGWLLLLFPGPRSGAAFTEPIDVPGAIALTWTAVVAEAGLLSTGFARVLRAAAVLAVLIASLAVGSALQSLGTPLPRVLPWLLSAALLVAALDRLPVWMAWTSHRPFAVLAGLGTAAIGPVLLHHLVAAFTSEGPPLWVAVTPPLLVAALLVRAPLPTWAPPWPATAWWRLWLAALFGVARVLPIFTAIALGVAPRRAMVVLALTPALAALLRRLRVPAAIPVAIWSLFYGTFTLVMTYKAGPDAETCAAVVRATDARVVLDRFREAARGGPDAELAMAEPYDVLPDPEAAALLVSWKRIGREGGFLVALDPDQPELRSLVPTRRPDGGPFWPERLERDSSSGRSWLQMLGIGAYAMWEIDTDRPAPGLPPTVRVTRRVPIRWEPGHPAIDGARRRLVLTYVPNRDATNPIVETLSLDDDRWTRTRKPRPRLEMSDFIAADSRTGRYLVPAFFDHVRFALVEVDGDTMAVRRWRETAFPSVGLAADGREARLYLTNVLGGDVVVVDMASMAPLHVLPAGAFPRDLVWDRERRHLWVANYGDGTVMDWDLRGAVPKEGGRHAVGPLLRGLGLDPTTGRVFAASACGVFEIPGGAP
jgi:hypothetical protein